LFPEEDEIVRGVGTGDNGLEELGLMSREVLTKGGKKRSGRGSGRSEGKRGGDELVVDLRRREVQEKEQSRRA